LGVKLLLNYQLKKMRLVRPISILTKEYIIGAIYEKVLLDNMLICGEKITLIAVIVQVSE